VAVIVTTVPGCVYLLLYSIGEMSVDNRVSCGFDVMRPGHQLTSLLTAFGFLVLFYGVQLQDRLNISPTSCNVCML
jgi:hypothetical protein